MTELFARHAIAALLLTCAAAQADPVPVPRPKPVLIRAVDGDTLAIGAERIRIVGVDTPETMHAKCPYERMLGEAATRAAEELLAGGGVAIARTGRPDKFGRTLAAVTVRGVPWLAAMSSAGAAIRPYDGGRRRGWC